MLEIVIIALIIVTGSVVTFSYSKRKNVPNPFNDEGRITDAGRFFGRQQVLKEIFEHLHQRNNVFLIGEKGIGKSSILSMVCKQVYGQFDFSAETFVYLDMREVGDDDDFFESLCVELGIPVRPPYELIRILKDKHYIGCLDHLESLSKAQLARMDSLLCNLAGGPLAPLTLVVASSIPLEKLFPPTYRRISSFAHTCHNVEVLPFSLNEMRIFIRSRLQPLGVEFDEPDMRTIWRETSGHPRRVQLVATEIFRQKLSKNSII